MNIYDIHEWQQNRCYWEHDAKEYIVRVIVQSDPEAVTQMKRYQCNSANDRDYPDAESCLEVLRQGWDSHAAIAYMIRMGHRRISFTEVVLEMAERYTGETHEYCADDGTLLTRRAGGRAGVLDTSE